MLQKNYRVGDIVDLDDVLISPAAYSAWQTSARRTMAALVAAGRLSRRTKIPDEQAKLLAGGVLEIFVDIPGVARLSMEIPAGHWQWS